MFLKAKDPDLKQKGVTSFAAFVASSDRVLMLWSLGSSGSCSNLFCDSFLDLLPERYDAPEVKSGVFAAAIRSEPEVYYIV